MLLNLSTDDFATQAVLGKIINPLIVEQEPWSGKRGGSAGKFSAALKPALHMAGQRG